MVHFTHVLFKAWPTSLGTTKMQLAALGLVAARADIRRPAALSAPARAPRALVTVMRDIPRTPLQRGGQVDDNAEAQWRHPTVSGIHSCGTTRPEPHSVERVVDWLRCQVFVELVLRELCRRPVRPRVQHPGIKDAHVKKGEVHTYRPIVRDQLVLQLQVVLPRSVVTVDLGTALVVSLDDLWLRHCEHHALSVIHHLPPPHAIVWRPRYGGRSGEDEGTPLPVHLQDGHHIGDPVRRGVDVQSVLPPLIQR